MSSPLAQQLFSHRFIREAARPMHLFFMATGVPLMVTSPATIKVTNSMWISSKRLESLFWLWTAFWVILNTHSEFYIFFRRAVKDTFKSLSRIDQLTGSELTEHFTSALIRSTSFLTETSTHYMLVLTIRSTLTRFCFALEPVDHLLGRPPLTTVRKGSLAALAFILYTVYHL